MSLQQIRNVQTRSINRKMHSECMKQRQQLSNNNTASSPILSRTTFSQSNKLDSVREPLQQKVNNRISDKEVIDLKFNTEEVVEVNFEGNNDNMKRIRSTSIDFENQSTISNTVVDKSDNDLILIDESSLKEIDEDWELLEVEEVLESRPTKSWFGSRH